MALTIVLATTTLYESDNRTTLTSTETSMIISTTTITSTATSTTQTTTFLPEVPWNNLILFLTNANPCTGPAPCFSSSFSQAFVFTCLQAAATPQGCTTRFNDTEYADVSYAITVWYPYVNRTAGAPSWANCAFNTPGGNPNQFYASFPSYCIPIGANSFILTMEGVVA